MADPAAPVPFHTVAAEQSEIVCRLHLGLLQGAVDRLGQSGGRSACSPSLHPVCVRRSCRSPPCTAFRPQPPPPHDPMHRTRPEWCASPPPPPRATPRRSNRRCDTFVRRQAIERHEVQRLDSRNDRAAHCGAVRCEGSLGDDGAPCRVLLARPYGGSGAAGRWSADRWQHPYATSVCGQVGDAASSCPQ